MNYKILITGIAAVVIGLVVATVTIGIRVRDVEVEKNAYETGLRFDEIEKKRALLGWRVEMPQQVAAGPASFPLLVTDDKRAAVENAVVELDFSRLGGGHEQQSYRCADAGNGRYLVRTQLDGPAWWDVRIRVQRRQDSLPFDAKIFVNK